MIGQELKQNFFLELAFACSETRQAFDAITNTSQPRRQLLAILVQKGELSHAALQSELSLDGATITRLVKEFEADGFLNRRLDPQNNRFTLVALTDSGRQKIAELQAAHFDFENELLSNISVEDLKTVVSVLEQVRENLHQSKPKKPVSEKK